MTTQELAQFIATLPEPDTLEQPLDLLDDLIRFAKESLLPPQLDLPEATILFLKKDQCPLCDQVVPIEWSDVEDQRPGFITRAGYCTNPACRSHFVITLTAQALQCYTDESLRFERGNAYRCYESFTLREQS